MQDEDSSPQHHDLKKVVRALLWPQRDPPYPESQHKEAHTKPRFFFFFVYAEFLIHPPSFGSITSGTIYLNFNSLFVNK